VGGCERAYRERELRLGYGNTEKRGRWVGGDQVADRGHDPLPPPSRYHSFHRILRGIRPWGSLSTTDSKPHIQTSKVTRTTKRFFDGLPTQVLDPNGVNTTQLLQHLSRFANSTARAFKQPTKRYRLSRGWWGEGASTNSYANSINAAVNTTTTTTTTIIPIIILKVHNRDLRYQPRPHGQKKKVSYYTCKA